PPPPATTTIYTPSLHDALPIYLLVAGDAAVHGDHQRGALVPQALDGVLGQAVALLDPAGDVPQAPGTAAFQIVQQQDRGGDAVRSEEHTSELQSRFDLVCRLLL